MFEFLKFFNHRRMKTRGCVQAFKFTTEKQKGN